MERREDHDPELIDLGAASVETKGPLGGHLDGVSGITNPGLSDADD
ncbi:MAG: benenodin family lasso peptide [Candidatus Sphingomonas colombiensis]|nr:benenodin family lasso peptide [Sphingomonas sp.]WEK43260.1 MAG: benenodin family lasso peptide [Sphingomonas sp.]